MDENINQNPPQPTIPDMPPPPPQVEDQPPQPPIAPKTNKNMLTGVSFLLLTFISLGVAVYFANQNRQLKNELSQAQKAQETPSPTQTTSSYNTWKKYSDTVYKFQISVPENWYIQPTGGLEVGSIYPGDTFHAYNYNHQDEELFDIKGKLSEKVENPIKVELSISTDNKQSLDSLSKEPSAMYGDTPKRVSSVIIDGKKGVKPTRSRSEYTSEGYIVLNDQNWAFYLTFFTRDGLARNRQVLDQILSTFKFLEE